MNKYYKVFISSTYADLKEECPSCMNILSLNYEYFVDKTKNML